MSEIIQDIDLYNQAGSRCLATNDVMTAVECGIKNRQKVFSYKHTTGAIISKDYLRTELQGEAGTIIQYMSKSSYLVSMDSVEECQIRLVTKDSIIQMLCPGDPLHELYARAVRDGDLDDFCNVLTGSNDTLFANKYYKIPSKWLRNCTLEKPTSSKWNVIVELQVLGENMVPYHDMETAEDIPCVGDGDSCMLDELAQIIEILDPLNEFTPKIFKTFEIPMDFWDDEGQKTAIVESLAQEHQDDPDEFLPGKKINKNDNVCFGWMDETGTQSVFESGDDCIYVVENTSPEILSEGRLARYMHNKYEWEIPIMPGEIRRNLSFRGVYKRDESLIVAGSRVTLRYDSTHAGTCMDICQDEIRCLVASNLTPDKYDTEYIASVERSFFMRSVKINLPWVVGKVTRIKLFEKPQDIEVDDSDADDMDLDDVENGTTSRCLVDFTGFSTMGDRIGQVWFDTNALEQRRLRYRLNTFMAYDCRVARFAVQECVGVSHWRSFLIFLLVFQ